MYAMLASLHPYLVLPHVCSSQTSSNPVLPFRARIYHHFNPIIYRLSFSPEFILHPDKKRKRKRYKPSALIRHWFLPVFKKNSNFQTFSFSQFPEKFLSNQCMKSLSITITVATIPRFYLLSEGLKSDLWYQKKAFCQPERREEFRTRLLGECSMDRKGCVRWVVGVWQKVACERYRIARWFLAGRSHQPFATPFSRHAGNEANSVRYASVYKVVPNIYLLTPDSRLRNSRSCRAANEEFLNFFFFQIT